LELFLALLNLFSRSKPARIRSKRVLEADVDRRSFYAIWTINKGLRVLALRFNVDS
jgi:hypothetical protein